MDDIDVVGYYVASFLLGVVVTALLLVCIPGVYRKLSGCLYAFRTKCSSCKIRCLHRRREAARDTPNDAAEKSKTMDAYAEIDEGKTQTFFSKRNCLKPSKPNMRYEEPKKEDYEDLEIGGSEDKPFSNHVYNIVDPETCKRLPVRMVDRKQGTFASDANHIYFVLEPGTNKVTPVFQNTADGSAEIEMDSQHMYFVLEAKDDDLDLPMAAPYAVNDISTEPFYFVLEKQ